MDDPSKRRERERVSHSVNRGGGHESKGDFSASLKEVLLSSHQWCVCVHCRWEDTLNSPRPLTDQARSFSFWTWFPLSCFLVSAIHSLSFFSFLYLFDFYCLPHVPSELSSCFFFFIISLILLQVMTILFNWADRRKKNISSTLSLSCVY